MEWSDIVDVYGPTVPGHTNSYFCRKHFYTFVDSKVSYFNNMIIMGDYNNVGVKFQLCFRVPKSLQWLSVSFQKCVAAKRLERGARSSLFVKLARVAPIIRGPSSRPPLIKTAFGQKKKLNTCNKCSSKKFVHFYECGRRGGGGTCAWRCL